MGISEEVRRRYYGGGRRVETPERMDNGQLIIDNAPQEQAVETPEDGARAVEMRRAATEEPQTQDARGDAETRGTGTEEPQEEPRKTRKTRKPRGE